MQILQRSDVAADDRIAGPGTPAAPVRVPEPQRPSCVLRIRVAIGSRTSLQSAFRLRFGAGTQGPPASATRPVVSCRAHIESAAAVMPLTSGSAAADAPPSARSRPGVGRAPAANALTTLGDERFGASSKNRRNVLPSITTASGPGRRKSDERLRPAFGTGNPERAGKGEAARNAASGLREATEERLPRAAERRLVGACPAAARSRKETQSPAFRKDGGRSRCRAGAVFRPVEDSFEALLCRASCCRLPAGNHAVAQRSLGAFKRDRPGIACRRDPDALRQPGPLVRADAGLHAEMPLTPWRLNASRDPSRARCSSSSSAHRSPASRIVPPTD